MAAEISRREILGLALVAPFLSLRFKSRSSASISRQNFINAPSRVIPLDPSHNVRGIEIIRKWNGSLCRSRLINHGREAVRIKEALQPPSGVAARFDDDSLQIGRVRLRDREVIAALNWSDEIKTISFRLREKSQVKDFWSGESLGQHEGKFIVEAMPKHSARLLICS